MPGGCGGRRVVLLRRGAEGRPGRSNTEAEEGRTNDDK